MQKSKELSPFKFGKVVDGTLFTNRTKEAERLKLNFLSGINTVLISPRRWGKSSLVKEVANQLKDDTKTVFVFLDLFSIRSEEAFYERFAREIFKATNNDVAEIFASIKEFFVKLVPKLSLDIDPSNQFSLSFDLKNGQHKDEILELPQKIAAKKGIRLVICLDEFQSIEQFDNPKAFQKLLRSIWQHHNLVSYCVYGSKRSMMTELFMKRQNPFYKFGDVLMLEKISTEHWVSFLQERFESTNKTIPEGIARKVTEIAENHSYYVQQLAHLLWLNCTDGADENALQKAKEELLNFNSLLFTREVEQLSNFQLQYLQALANGVDKFTSKETLKNYNLGSVGNIKRIREALENKDLIDTFTGKPEFVDPIFKLWLHQFVFA